MNLCRFLYFTQRLSNYILLSSNILIKEECTDFNVKHNLRDKTDFSNFTAEN